MHTLLYLGKRTRTGGDRAAAAVEPGGADDSPHGPGSKRQRAVEMAASGTGIAVGRADSIVG